MPQDRGELCVRKAWLFCSRTCCVPSWTTRMRAWPGLWRRLTAHWRAASAGPVSLRIYAASPLAGVCRGSAAVVTTVTETSIAISGRKRFRFSRPAVDSERLLEPIFSKIHLGARLVRLDIAHNELINLQPST